MIFVSLRLSRNRYPESWFYQSYAACSWTPQDGSVPATPTLAKIRSTVIGKTIRLKLIIGRTTGRANSKRVHIAIDPRIKNDYARLCDLPADAHGSMFRKRGYGFERLLADL